MAEYPASLPTFTDLDGNLTLAANNHANRHNKVHQEIGALFAKVGVNGSVVTTTHDYKLSGIADADKAVSKTGSETLTNKTLTSPVINTSISGSAVLDEDNMASNSDTKVATQQSIKAYIDSAIAATKSALYPIGSYYFNETDSTNPATLLGFGTWVAIQNTFIVGKGSGTFATAGATGGSESHKHKGYGDNDSGETAGDLRAAIGAGNSNANTLAYNSTSAANPNTGAGVSQSGYVVTGSSSSASWSPWNHFTPVYGYTSTKNHLPPYKVAYIWKRTA